MNAIELLTLGKKLLATLSKITPRSQYLATLEGLRGEEAEAFAEIITRVCGIWEAMPVTYATDGQPDALAHVHYFTGGCDWWIVEKDSDPDDEGQIQAFGVANLGHGPELGYISILELLENGAELDYHFTPAPYRNFMN